MRNLIMKMGLNGRKRIAAVALFVALACAGGVFGQIPTPSEETSGTVVPAGGESGSKKDDSEKPEGFLGNFEEFMDGVEGMANDFEPGPAAFFLVLGGCLVLIGMGSVLALVVLAITGFLLLLLILTISMVIGVWRKRPGTAVRTCVIQVSAAAGVLFGIVAVWVVCFLRDAQTTWESVVWRGSLYGALGGIAIALLFNFACLGMYRLVVKTYGPEEGSPSRVRIPSPRR